MQKDCDSFNPSNYLRKLENFNMETFKAILFYFLALGILGVVFIGIETSSALGGILILGGFFYFIYKWQ